MATKTRTFEFSQDEYEGLCSEYAGFCVSCGEQRDSCEPDVRNYECEACGERKVFGLEELLMMGLVEITDE